MKQDLNLLHNMIYTKNFSHVFQPLIDLQTWEVNGFEALFRSKLVDSPEQLFSLAMKNNMLYELDTHSIYHALLTASKRKSIHRLFINIYPSTMMHPFFEPFLNKLYLNGLIMNTKVIVEISEAEEIKDLLGMKSVIELMRELGIGIAIDDYGKGETTLQTIIDIEPDIVKLDKTFSSRLALSLDKQSEVRKLANICQNEKMKLVLEGMENHSELVIAKMLGIDLGQGYLIGRPKEM
ncbi:EAL domain-containing protein [Aquibacillus sediminis]|uniref:EAL domain-containing protein n=1 Tax=Aquibacillus sediminis TaxID=2574734 RepID=UPI001486F59C|nr:EAL domain-containing protein [Aquibacillus sediminis]